MSAAQLLAGVGTYSFWGSSATFDFIEAYIHVNNNSSSSKASISSDKSTLELFVEPIRVLLVNPSDIRHIITTIANKFQHSNLPPIEFYIIDSPIEVLARNILLLEVLSDFDIPIRQRANTFLEIYGNSKLQERTSKYIESLGNQLRNLAVYNKGRLQDLIDLSNLKYREKDMLEECFKSYVITNISTKITSTSSSSYPFDIDHYRDYRMRSYYSDRYDNRLAIADWDYHESIRTRASIIHIRQYKDWRNSGIAFEFGDQTYTHSNRTLMAYAEGYIKHGKDKGMKKEVKGYWGDMVNSPYYTFGIDCVTNDKLSKGLFDIHNKNTGSEQHRHHTVEIALFNILSYLYQIENREIYGMKIDHDIFSGLGGVENVTKTMEQNNNNINDSNKSDSNTMTTIVPAIAPVAMIDEKATIEEILEGEELEKSMKMKQEDENRMEEEQAKKRAENIFESYQHIKIFPILGPVSEKMDKPKFESYFDMVFISAKSAQIIQEDYFKKLLRPNALVAIETAKFYIPLSKAEQKLEFVRKIEEYASKQGFHKITAPVPRRYRDELDTEDDVVFFMK